MNTNFLKSILIVVVILTTLSLPALQGCEGEGPAFNCTEECNEPYEVLFEEDDFCTCKCAPGWTGPDCTELDEGNCETLICQHGGEKVGRELCHCECPPGWGGELCEIQTTTCPGVECPAGKHPNPEKECACE